MLVDTFPAAGVVTIDLIDGIGGSVIADGQGTNNSFTVNPQSGGDLTEGAWVNVNGFFRMPAAIPSLVYLRIRQSTAISSGTSLFLDDAAFRQATELYAGGPLVACFDGKTAFSIADKWTVTAGNGREGLLQEWFWRNQLVADGQLLPSDAAGGETIADTLIG